MLLQTLVDVHWHGIVDKGFRGEFIAKVLLCNAMEDILRPTSERRRGLQLNKWGYPWAVHVSSSPTCLLSRTQSLNALLLIANRFLRIGHPGDVTTQVIVISFEKVGTSDSVRVLL
jgi:hypothetical protein